MVIRNLYLVSIAFAPFETYAPLVIDADAVLTSPIPCEFFKPVAGRHTEICEAIRCIQDGEFSPCQAMKIRRQPLRELTSEDPFRFFIVERLDHLLQ